MRHGKICKSCVFVVLYARNFLEVWFWFESNYRRVCAFNGWTWNLLMEIHSPPATLVPVHTCTHNFREGPHKHNTAGIECKRHVRVWTRVAPSEGRERAGLWRHETRLTGLASISSSLCRGLDACLLPLLPPPSPVYMVSLLMPCLL